MIWIAGGFTHGNTQSQKVFGIHLLTFQGLRGWGWDFGVGRMMEAESFSGEIWRQKYDLEHGC